MCYFLRVHVRKWGNLISARFSILDLTVLCAVRYEAWPSLRKSPPAWANSLTNWPTPNPCAAAHYPSARFGVVKQGALVPTTPRPATVRITA
jgi:hypothetical protein